VESGRHSGDVDALLALALDLLDRRLPGPDGPPPGPVAAPGLPPDRFATAGFASGLTAAIGVWAAAVDVALPVGWDAVLERERAAVAARHRRFAEALPRVLGALATAGVAAVPVKGAVLTRGPWPDGDARPMADVDLVVPPDRRAEAGRALAAAGFAPLGSMPWEDTFTLWPGRPPWPTDGESPDHPGKLEVHPGWVERLHDYLVGDHGAVTGRARPGELAGAPCHLLDPAAVAAQAIGHQSASVVRADVRALQVVDAVVVLRRLDAAARRDLADLWEQLDPRLVAPGLWLVAAHRPGAIPAGALVGALDRLGEGGRRRLAAAAPAGVLRSGAGRTDWRWRRSFVRTPAEGARALRQLVLPAATDRPAGAGALAAHAGRAVRAARRRRVP
jgi:hypothetical protein